MGRRCIPAAAALLKLPSYPWQSKRFWNETQEAAEALHYKPVHPLLGQPVSARAPDLGSRTEHQPRPVPRRSPRAGQRCRPGAVYVEMALAAARETYGSDLSVDDLVLHRALILDDTCDPILRTTLNEDNGALEFAAFTAIGRRGPQVDDHGDRGAQHAPEAPRPP